MSWEAWRERRLWVPWLAVSVSLIARIAFWFRRDFNHDDFFAAYIGSIRALGAKPGVDFYVPNFTPAGELLTPLFRWFPDSFIPLDVARSVVLVISLLLLWLCWQLTRELGGSAPAAVLAVLMVTWQSDFVARIADVRAEPAAALFLLASTLCLIRRYFSWSGFFLGLAIALTYKYLIAGPFLLVGLFLLAGRRLRPCLIFGSSSVVAPLIYYGWRLVADGREVFLAVLHEVVTGSVASGSNKGFYLARTLWSSWFSLVLITAGLLTAVWSFSRRREDAHLATYASLASVFTIVYLVAIPFIFPYTAVLLLPILAPLVAGLSPLLDRIRRWELQAAVIAVVTLCLVFQGLPSLVTTSRRTSDHQRRVVQWIWRNSEISDHVFDWQGMHFGRHGIFHWYQFGALRDRYDQGWYSLADEWRRSEVRLLVDNFRFGYMKKTDREFLASHFVRVDRCLLVPGRVFTDPELRAGATFDAVAGGMYRVGGGPLRIDGNRAGASVELSAGSHVVTRPYNPTNGPGGLILISAKSSSDRSPCPPAGEPLLYGFD